MASKQDLIKSIDDEFGDEFESLEGCRKLKERLENKLKNLKEQVFLTLNPTSSKQSCVLTFRLRFPMKILILRKW